MTISANARALLHTIYNAEGTFKNGQPIYNQTFGYTPFDTSKPHPNRVVRSGGYASAAAGAGQFMPDTWKMVWGGQNRPMTPENQDAAALELVRRRGVNPDAPLTADALNKLAPEWASLPTHSGSSYYGQPVRGRDELLKFYGDQLNAIRGGGAGAPAGGGRPAPAAPSGGGSVPTGGGGGGGGDTAALLALVQATSGNSTDNSMLLSAIAGSGGDPTLPVLSAIQKESSQAIDELGSGLREFRPMAVARIAPGGGARMAGGSAFRQALSLLQA